MAKLGKYLEMRDFGRTPEPSDPGAPTQLALRYSMQKHAARRLHWDLRLEWDGVLLSWAVTRGPSFDPKGKRLAVRTEDHPLSYLQFEGVIPQGNYGAGTVMLWDIGHWEPQGDAARGLKKGHLRFRLHGRRNTGEWSLVRMKGKTPADRVRENWLLIKSEDEAAHQPDPVRRYQCSVASNRSMKEIADGRDPRAFGPKRTQTGPRFRQPQLAALADLTEAEGREWQELKHDGYRALISLGKGGARIFTRSGKDWTDRFAPLLPPLEELPAETALLDGEIVAGAGLDGFASLQKAIDLQGPYTLYLFDILSLDGSDITRRPLHERRKALEELFNEVPPRGLLRLTPVIDGPPAPVYDAICDAGGEGLISKRADAPYRSGRSRAWLKLKCEQRAEFLICGYQRSDKRARAFASLLLATQEHDGLVYRGKVGTGFDANTQSELARRLQELHRATPPLNDPPTELRGVVWVRPELVAEIRYAEVTPQGRLRHASFIALRRDKSAREVRMDKKTGPRASDTKSDGFKLAGVHISSADRLVYPEAAITKGRVAEYYAGVAENMLQVVADRPLSLLRLPTGLGGERFFQKHIGKGFPDQIRPLAIAEADGQEAEYFYVSSAAGLVAAAQMGAIEFHVWGARRDMLEKPDRMVFDLDPDEGLDFATVRSAAFDLRDALSDLGLPSWAMLTGGKGVHVVVPLRRSVGWETLKLFAHTFAVLHAERYPDRFTASLSKARRKGRIFIDYLRNERGATAVAPFSLRARSGAPVAIPVTWKELEDIPGATAFSLGDALHRGWDGVEIPSPVALSKKIVESLASGLH